MERNAVFLARRRPCLRTTSSIDAPQHRSGLSPHGGAATPVMALSILLTLCGTSATADPITLTSGFLSLDDTVVQVDLQGRNGFQISGTGSITAGLFPIRNQCIQGECSPGRTVPLTAVWIGIDFRGSATVDGSSFEIGGFDAGNAGVDFAGSFTAPPSRATTTPQCLLRSP